MWQYFLGPGPRRTWWRDRFSGWTWVAVLSCVTTKALVFSPVKWAWQSSFHWIVARLSEIAHVKYRHRPRHTKGAQQTLALIIHQYYLLLQTHLQLQMPETFTLLLFQRVTTLSPLSPPGTGRNQPQSGPLCTQGNAGLPGGNGAASTSGRERWMSTAGSQARRGKIQLKTLATSWESHT